MRSFAALIRKDLKGYFDQPTGYILQVVFVGVASYLFFRAALVGEEASLRVLFGILPWMLTVFVAAATMRLLAEEQRDGTLEILLTQPIQAWTVLLAKFLAGLTFVLTGVVFTVGIPLALESAGDLDRGAVVAQYVGTFFLTASFVAIGLFGSSLTRNQIVAFILALTLIIMLMLGGLPLVTLALPSAAATLLNDLSPLTHFRAITRGVLDLRDILYFVALTATFLSATYLMVRSKSISHHSPLYRNLQLGVGGLVVISLVVGLFGGSIGGRWDLTESRLYTLSSGTKELLSGLDDIVTINHFSSKNPPVQTALVSRDVNDFLDDVAAASAGNVRVVRWYPDVDEGAKQGSEQSLIPPAQVNVQSRGELKAKQVWQGVVIRYANRQEVIPYISSVDGIEYQLVSKVYRMLQREPKTVAFLFGHGEKGKDQDLRVFSTELERQHNVISIREGEDEVLDLSGVDVLIVAGPAGPDHIPVKVREQIDEYLAGGGKALILVDPVRVSQGAVLGGASPYALLDYLANYGVRPHVDVVFDMRSNETLGFRSPLGVVSLSYPYWARVPTVETKISGGVQSVVLPWASSLEVIEPAATTTKIDVDVTRLLETRSSAGVDDEFRNVSLDSPVLARVSEKDLGRRLMAVAVTGTRCPPSNPQCELTADKTFRMIVVGDSEWVTNVMADRYDGQVTLASNWIDWLTQEDTLAGIRGKGAQFRPLFFDSEVHRNLVQYGNVVGAPALLVVLGLLRYVMRQRTQRRTYSREE